MIRGLHKSGRINPSAREWWKMRNTLEALFGEAYLEASTTLRPLTLGHPLIFRSAIEEDYARRLQKLSKTTMGKDEIGDLAAALQNCLAETAQQGQYHQALATEIRTNVEQPTAELSARLVGFKKGQQASIEKAWRNKGLQEGHVSKVSDVAERVEIC